MAKISKTTTSVKSAVRSAVLSGAGSNQPNLKGLSRTSKPRGTGKTTASKFGGKV